MELKGENSWFTDYLIHSSAALSYGKSLSKIADWFDEHGLIINLKKGKMESLPFRTSQRITKQSETLDVMYQDSTILNTKQYKYLGIEVDCTLNLNSHIEKCFKRASSRLRLSMTSTQAKRLTSFCDRCLTIISGNSKNPIAIQSVANTKGTRACKLVRKCLDNDICENF